MKLDEVSAVWLTLQEVELASASGGARVLGAATEPRLLDAVLFEGYPTSAPPPMVTGGESWRTSSADRGLPEASASAGSGPFEDLAPAYVFELPYESPPLADDHLAPDASPSVSLPEVPDASASASASDATAHEAPAAEDAEDAQDAAVDAATDPRAQDAAVDVPPDEGAQDAAVDVASDQDAQDAAVDAASDQDAQDAAVDAASDQDAQDAAVDTGTDQEAQDAAVDAATEQDAQDAAAAQAVQDAASDQAAQDAAAAQAAQDAAAAEAAALQAAQETAAAQAVIDAQIQQTADAMRAAQAERDAHNRYHGWELQQLGGATGTLPAGLSYDGIRYNSPLVLDLDRDGIEIVSREDSHAHFDIDLDGTADHTGWVGPRDGLLTLDRNDNGVVDDRAELFGNLEGAAHGFEHLARLDSNADGVIDANDSVYERLAVWTDTNGDGRSERSELTSLAAAGVRSIKLEATEVNEQVGSERISHRSSFIGDDGVEGRVDDVWFSYTPGSPT